MPISSQSGQWFHLQRDLDIVAENRDVPGASNPPESVPAIKNVTRQQATEYLNAPQEDYTPPITVTYRKWELRTASDALLAPTALFLLFFEPVLDLLTFHTSAAAQRVQTTFKTITDLEMRRYLAIRLDMARNLSICAEMRSFWRPPRPSTRMLSLHRFLEIHQHLSVDSTPTAIIETYPVPTTWFWKVERALNALRAQLRTVTIPSSHLAVDESSIKFHGRKKDTYRMPHKPAREGFNFYAVGSRQGIIHDFVVTSSQKGVEDVPDGITLDLPTRSVRNRKRGHSGDKSASISLPPTKGLVYSVLQRVTAEERATKQRRFVCVVDNLFVDPNLARALLTLNIGLIGTTRKNVPEVPAPLLAIVHRFPDLLGPDQTKTVVIDRLVAAIAWHDPLREKRLIMISTIHRPDARKTTLRTVPPKNSTRACPVGYKRSAESQPAVAVDYNDYMGAVDNGNRYRSSTSVRRRGQLKWTKAMIDYMIDIAQNNAFLIYKTYTTPDTLHHRDHEYFLQELVDGLLEITDKPHEAFQAAKSNYCQWEGCKPRGYTSRAVLGEISGNESKKQTRRTDYHCKQCDKTLCSGPRGCFKAYHVAHGLPTLI